MTDNPRGYERYFARGQRFCTPEELDAMLKVFRTPDAVIERHMRIDAMLKRDEDRKTRWDSIKWTLATFVGLLSALALVTTILTAWGVL